MGFRRWSIAGLTALLIAGGSQAGKPTLPVPGSQLGVIGVQVKAKGPTAVSAPSHASEVFFVKVEEDGDMLRATEIIPSNYTSKKQVFLLNAEPGRYVAVAAFVEADVSLPSSNVYFAGEMIPGTEVSLKAGQAVFMGKIVVKVKAGMKKADEAQAHYAKLIGSGIGFAEGEHSSFIAISHITRAAEFKELAKDVNIERDFWARAADKAFKSAPLWQETVHQQLASLK